MLARIIQNEAYRLKVISPRTDAQVVQVVLAGDTDAFALLVERYQRKVFNLVCRMVGNRTDAEDVAQEIFCKLYQNLHRYDASLPLENWLMRMASNHALNFLAKKHIETTPIESEQPDGEVKRLHLVEKRPSPGDRAEMNETGAHIIAALQRIPSVYRLVFILKYLNEYTAEEIAEIVGSQRNTVKTWIFRARESLKAELEHLVPSPGSRQ